MAQQIALMAASAMLSKMSGDSQTRRQESLAKQMTQYRLGKSAEAEAAIKKFTDTQQPEALAARTGDVQAGLAADLNAARSSAQGYEKTGAVSGRFGPEYSARNASNKAAVSDRITQAIKNLAAIGTPGQRAVNDSINYGRAATDVAGATQAANNVSQVYGNAIQGAQPDAFLSLASELAKGAGLVSAMKGGAASANPTAYSLSSGKLLTGLKNTATPALGFRL